MSAAVLNFFLSTIYSSHPTTIVNKSPADAYDFLSSLGTSTSIDDFIHFNPAPKLNALKSLDAFQKACLALCAIIDEVNGASIYATPRSKILALWSSLPRSRASTTLKQA